VERPNADHRQWSSHFLLKNTFLEVAPPLEERRAPRRSASVGDEARSASGSSSSSQDQRLIRLDRIILNATPGEGSRRESRQQEDEEDEEDEEEEEEQDVPKGASEEDAKRLSLIRREKAEREFLAQAERELLARKEERKRRASGKTQAEQEAKSVEEEALRQGGRVRIADTDSKGKSKSLVRTSSTERVKLGGQSNKGGGGEGSEESSSGQQKPRRAAFSQILAQRTPSGTRLPNGSRRSAPAPVDGMVASMVAAASSSRARTPPPQSGAAPALAGEPADTPLAMRSPPSVGTIRQRSRQRLAEQLVAEASSAAMAADQAAAFAESAAAAARAASLAAERRRSAAPSPQVEKPASRAKSREPLAEKDPAGVASWIGTPSKRDESDIVAEEKDSARVIAWKQRIAAVEAKTNRVDWMSNELALLDTNNTEALCGVSHHGQSPILVTAPHTIFLLRDGNAPHVVEVQTAGVTSALAKELGGACLQWTNREQRRSELLWNLSRANGMPDGALLDPRNRDPNYLSTVELGMNDWHQHMVNTASEWQANHGNGRAMLHIDIHGCKNPPHTPSHLTVGLGAMLRRAERNDDDKERELALAFGSALRAELSEAIGQLENLQPSAQLVRVIVPGSAGQDYARFSGAWPVETCRHTQSQQAVAFAGFSHSVQLELSKSLRKALIEDETAAPRLGNALRAAWAKAKRLQDPGGRAT